MNTQRLSIEACEFELLTDGDRFAGVGEVIIGNTAVRSGRLPLQPMTESFSGLALRELRLLDVIQSADEIRIETEASFAPMFTKVMRDHSFDPIHDLGDWNSNSVAGTGKLTLVLRRAADTFGDHEFSGFAYHYEYESENVPLYWLMDRASWELDGTIAGATAVSQSACSDPIVTFEPETAWTTEGVLHFADNAAAANNVMTHNLPRWASHQAFDFQYKGEKTLLGVYERVELIRSVLAREAGKAELKTFDKHIFDESLRFSTSPKKILINEEPKSSIDQRNLWTWTIQEVHDRARAEFGLEEEPTTTYLGHPYWEGWTIDTYYKDSLPAAANIGVEEFWFENVKKSAYSEKAPLKGVWNWNKCCNHEYEVAESLGGVPKLKEFVQRIRRLGLQPINWTNNSQGHSSPLNRQERFHEGSWFVMMEDTRQKYGGAYLGCMSALDFKNDDMRRYFIDAHKQIKEQTGLNRYLFDSFYNLGFMPVNFSYGRPTTMWRELLQAIKELQEADIHFRIESFGPFGQPMHGCPRSYSLENCWVAYKIQLGNDYTTVPSGKTYDDPRTGQVDGIFYALAHMALPTFRLFGPDGKRIDEDWTDAHRQALRDYAENRRFMRIRYLQNDGQSVVWHDEAGERATIFNFAERKAALPGAVYDHTAGESLPKAENYELQKNHVYVVSGCELPQTVISDR